MMRVCVGAAVLLGLTAPAWADQAEGSEAPDAVQAADEAQFAELVAKGDRERAAGRLPEAATAYAQALGIRGDPLVAGRLGVLLVKLGRPEHAAERLLDAIQRATQASSQERQGFLRAYDEALAQGCWVQVVISHAHTRVTLDGKPKNRAGHSAFFVFATAGEHEIRASLEGYQDASAKFTAIKGTDMEVMLTLRPLPPAESTPTPAPPQPKRTEAGPGPALRPAARSPVAVAAPASLLRLAVGPSIVIGAAPTPAFGLSGTLQYRRQRWWSLSGEFRAARTFADIEGAPLRTLTLGINLVPCGHLRWFFGCAVVHAGGIHREAVSSPIRFDAAMRFAFGGGLQLGAEYFINPNLGLRVASDIIKLTQPLDVEIAGYGVIWESIGLLGSATVAIATAF
jgi:hypothetical protein